MMRALNTGKPRPDPEPLDPHPFNDDNAMHQNGDVAVAGDGLKGSALLTLKE